MRIFERWCFGLCWNLRLSFKNSIHFFSSINELIVNDNMQQCGAHGFLSYLDGAKVNQHPPVHQLAVLSMGWAAFFHSVSNPMLTQHCNTVNFLGCWLLTLFICWVFFFNPDHTIFQPNHPSSLATLLT